MYYNDIFYNTRELSLQEKITVLEEGKSLCYEWWVDKLDCSESFARRRINMSFEEIMDMLDNSCHFTIIHRRGYPKQPHEMWKLEIGFSTMKAIDYFLWIHVKEEHIPHFEKKYHLNPIL